MSEGLGREARALLDAARGGLTPDAAAVRRMRGRLDVAMTRAAVKASASKLGLGAKLAGVALAVVAAGTLAFVRHGAPSELRGVGTAVTPGRAMVAAREPVAPTVGAMPAAREPVAVTAGDATRVAVTSVTREPLAPTVPARKQVTDPVAPHATIVEPAPASLALEVELVDLAMAALHRGEPRTALRTVAVHARETAGHGQLAEDAAAIEVEALCQLHDPSIADHLATFDQRFPRSAQRARLTAACR